MTPITTKMPIKMPTLNISVLSPVRDNKNKLKNSLFYCLKFAVIISKVYAVKDMKIV